ncbi:hypothetical protein [Candidatus Azobacteroides pseudotrichonymphae]|uniref:Lipoprotein n=1 Tax=Azobacteroides pseudotrichonymphae genomovar. CFP2 TaxID=511995 RepID=B6YS83_AZOPC|nr:hypothetical protein [Candidatus Azobacteroides pseudotrichonymphae]BAG84055.1 hypothetical protein CFPG_P1-34 [Candidatus Azobacteroides pseudotrichonymphae genomovar. CFP2]
MKKLLFLFYSLVLLFVTVSVSSCKKRWVSDSKEHCTVYFKDGTKKEFDIDCKYQLNYGLEGWLGDYPYPDGQWLEDTTCHFGTFHINLYEVYGKNNGISLPDRFEDTGDYYHHGNRCCHIGWSDYAPTQEGCLKEMERIAKVIGGEVKQYHHYDYITLCTHSLKDVIGYSLRSKDYEKTIREFE